MQGIDGALQYRGAQAKINTWNISGCMARRCRRRLVAFPIQSATAPSALTCNAGHQEPVERFLFTRATATVKPIREALIHWVANNDEDVRVAYENHPDLPWLSDRDADLWMPLFAVASIAAPDRVAELKCSARTLTGAKQADEVENSLPIKLLSDIKSIGLKEQLNWAAPACWRSCASWKIASGSSMKRPQERLQSGYGHSASSHERCA